MDTVSKNVVLITGASSGIGKELARLFAHDKHDLFLVARDELGLKNVQADLQKAYGVRVAIVAGDLTDKNFLYSLPEKIHSQGFQVACLVNNAGAGVTGDFATTDWAKEESSIVLNAIVPTYLSKVLIADLEKTHGSILNIVSMGAFLPTASMSVYFATKAYLASLSESLSLELAKKGIRVTALYPGPARTGFQKHNDLKELPSRFPDARAVAEQGYQGWKKEKIRVIPGWRNKGMYFVNKLAPKFLVLLAVRRVRNPFRLRRKGA